MHIVVQTKKNVYKKKKLYSQILHWRRKDPNDKKLKHQKSIKMIKKNLVALMKKEQKYKSGFTIFVV